MFIKHIYKDAVRHKYRTPDIFILSFEFDCLIAQSPLEDPIEGEEWTWEG